MVFDWSRIHASRSRSVLTWPLALCSVLYGLGVRIDRARHRRRGGDRLPGLVVSVGGMTAGGAGKTPVTAALAEWALERGHRVAVLSRGYGRKRGDELITVSDGKRVLAGAAEAGDEPCMLAERLPHVPVVVCKKRSLAGRFAHRTWGANVFVLDDAFQHWEVMRDVDVVLLDAEDPVGNGHLLPWGPLREPVDALGRAHIAVITRSKSLEGAGEPADMLLSRFPTLPRVRSVHVPSGVCFPARSVESDPVHLRGRRVAAFCGIAKPAAFRETLAGLGAEVTAFQPFQDHHPYSRGDIERLLGVFRRSGADFLLTTEKDWMRVPPLLAQESRAGFLRVVLEFSNGAAALFDMLERAAKNKNLLHTESP